MKNNFLKRALPMILALAMLTLSFSSNDPESLSIGAAAPKADMKMPDISGKSLSLNDIKKSNGLLVIFSCNTCPFVVGAEGYGEGWEGRYNEIKKLCDDSNVGMVLVNSNEGKRDKGDNLDDMKKRAQVQEFANINYVLDQNSALADVFGARTTPHVFLFNKDMKLAYKGAIDDSNESPDKVTQPWLKNAISNISQGKAADPAESRPMGCSIKRVVKN